MSLTRKHFKQLANIIKHSKEHNHLTRGQLIVFIENEITQFCRQHNPNFNASTFSEACEFKPVDIERKENYQ
jgi:hypothetical protein